jgi:hypothetical protein
MAWENKTPGEICRQMLDRRRNGNKSLAQIVHHLTRRCARRVGLEPGRRRDWQGARARADRKTRIQSHCERVGEVWRGVSEINPQRTSELCSSAQETLSGGAAEKARTRFGALLLAQENA